MSLIFGGAMRGTLEGDQEEVVVNAQVPRGGEADLLRSRSSCKRRRTDTRRSLED